MSAEYRTFLPNDIDSLISLMAQLGYAHDKESLMDNIRLIREQNGEVWVADVTSKVCGCVAAIIDIRLAEGKKGEIVSLVVDESARGHGVGKGLLNHAEKWLIERVDTVRLRANSKREKAHELYQSLGYVSTKSQILFDKSV